MLNVDYSFSILNIEVLKVEQSLVLNHLVYNLSVNGSWRKKKWKSESKPFVHLFNVIWILSAWLGENDFFFFFFKFLKFTGV